MSTNKDPRQVRVAASQRDGAVIEVDGHNVASAVEAYRITQTVDEGPELTLYVQSGWKGLEFDGLADVVVEPAGVRQVVIGFLDSVDAAKLDAAVLDRDDLDGAPGELTRGLLAQLRDWAVEGAA
ncbi:hypothetical protein OG897_35775 [Streptomyces sp. NBC_00237]|uniref:hypothetical protein n=1 Tax=Streptomyces sp. NBC_00237 TaxID=2975687 RepID=UPI00224D27B8|nr:hypothetical protein [Streptomyces sp. NBC_00237]MCX5206752.1 hypothetical protein [Streptomyces sp. NBC_00237]